MVSLSDRAVYNLLIFNDTDTGTLMKKLQVANGDSPVKVSEISLGDVETTVLSLQCSLFQTAWQTFGPLRVQILTGIAACVLLI